MTAASPFDILLAAALLWTGTLVLVSRSFLRAAVIFIAFGLLMSLAWVRLLAPDIALAEAAIGAGITGVLLIDALRYMEWGGTPQPGALFNEATAARRWVARAGPGLGAAGVFVLLVLAVGALPATPAGLAGAVQDTPLEGVSHPVTAVLLVFRSFDTLLELGILALAVLAMMAVRGTDELPLAGLPPVRDPVLDGVVRILVPLSILVGGYLLWLGTVTAGGAFQAGVVLGSCGILLWLAGHRTLAAAPVWLWGIFVLAGFGALLAFAAASLAAGGRAFEYPDGQIHRLLPVLEAAAAVAIGASLAALFVGLHPGRDAYAVRSDQPGPPG